MGAQMWGKSLATLIAITLIITIGYIVTSRNVAKVYPPTGTIAAESESDDSDCGSVFV